MAEIVDRHRGVKEIIGDLIVIVVKKGSDAYERSYLKTFVRKKL